MPTFVCPRDATPLTLAPDVLGAGVAAHACAKCAGVLIEVSSGQQFFTGIGLTVKDPRTIIADAVASARSSAPVACTVCEAAEMKPFVFKGVELDLCPACGAGWLDRGELSRITNGQLGKNIEQLLEPVAGETSTVVGVYQMFWNCGYCRAQELLGKAHRYCPSCGAQQNAAWRYFPPAGKEVPASAQYDGSDKECPACQVPNGAKSNNCCNCGSPLEGAVAVVPVADRSTAAAAVRKGASRWRSLWRWLKWSLIGLATAFIVFIILALVWKKNVNVTVQSHAWQREIDIESLRAESDNSWCSSMPSGAYGVSRHREQRSTRQVANGEECSTRDVDRGDGTFERRKECHTKYKDEAVYDDKCYYTINRWSVSRTAKSAGVGTLPAPAWPTITLVRTGNSLGCERQGTRRETYQLKLRGADAKDYECKLEEAPWARVQDGLAKPVKIGVLTGIADCGSL